MSGTEKANDKPESIQNTVHMRQSSLSKSWQRKDTLKSRNAEAKSPKDFYCWHHMMVLPETFGWGRRLCVAITRQKLGEIWPGTLLRDTEAWEREGFQRDWDSRHIDLTSRLEQHTLTLTQ